jgi:hypothetical protein
LPVADAGVKAAAGRDEQRESATGLFVVNAYVSILVERHLFLL